MATFREQVETQTEAWAERRRRNGHRTSPATQQAWAEADACAAAQSLIGDPRRRPYAADDDLKLLRQEALDALMALDRALNTKAFALSDADNEGGEG